MKVQALTQEVEDKMYNDQKKQAKDLIEKKKLKISEIENQIKDLEMYLIKVQEEYDDLLNMDVKDIKTLKIGGLIGVKLNWDRPWDISNIGNKNG